jgi:hypothetical protein
MKAETAARLTELALRVTGDFNEMAKEIEAREPADEFKRLRGAIGRAMGAITSRFLSQRFRSTQASFQTT